VDNVRCPRVPGTDVTAETIKVLKPGVADTVCTCCLSSYLGFVCSFPSKWWGWRESRRRQVCSACSDYLLF